LDDALPIEVKSEEFSKRKADCAVRALIGAAKRYGVPFNFRRLECNGQRKIILKVGRVILIQETFCNPREEPQTAAYKIDLANTHGLIRQLELDLGDQPHRIIDWSGSVMAVLLHGAAGPRFSERDKALGGLMLGVPNERYDSWLVRLDLTKLAIHGVGADAPEQRSETRTATVQEDAVHVTLRPRKESTGTTQ
jgi:hypothetical protein